MLKEIDEDITFSKKEEFKEQAGIKKTGRYKNQLYILEVKNKIIEIKNQCLRW